MFGCECAGAGPYLIIKGIRVFGIQGCRVWVCGCARAGPHLVIKGFRDLGLQGFRVWVCGCAGVWVRVLGF